MRKIHLVCNAHLDPVWQWEWEEGAAAAVSTFRAAADFCEEFEGFIFNHNEAILYRWVEEYEPHLFARIQRLVAQGKWHILGGWYLQPDCNMPSGESFVRQILVGQKYFLEKFGVSFKTAINFDSFGHSRGLVQIMKKSGYDSYVFMRPDQGDFFVQPGDFVWVGFDGSEILTHKIIPGYNTGMGMADQKIRHFIENFKDKPVTMALWGVGNHGGGPSRQDLRAIRTLIDGHDDVQILHSTPENYFEDIKPTADSLKRVERDLNPRFPGCYTSQIRIKQKHRKLENELYLTEKMLAQACVRGLADYATEDMEEAFRDLLNSEFHDILPGSSVQPVEETSLRIMDHGLEIASRLKARAFFALAAGQEKAGEGEYPVLIYNPHPYKIKGVFECEFMLSDQNWKDEFSMPVVYRDGVRLPSQPEKEVSNLSLDWRKRVAFQAELEPSQMNRFICRIETLPKKPVPQLIEKDGKISFSNGQMEVVINTSTGLIDKYAVNGRDYLKTEAFKLLVLGDSEDSWRMDTNRFDAIEGSFSLLDSKTAAWYAGVKARELSAVRVIEDGAVRTVIEALFGYGQSNVCVTYRLPKSGTEIEVLVRVNWNEKTKMLKLSLPALIDSPCYIGQTAYGTGSLPMDGDEAVSQKWCGAYSDTDGAMLTCINDGIYGSSFVEGDIRLTLLRSAGFCAHPIMDRPILPQDRYSPRMEQGERIYTFRINAGAKDDRLSLVDREALIFAEAPYTLSFFPSGEGADTGSVIRVDGESIIMTAFKPAEDGNGYIVRLYNPTEAMKSADISIPLLGVEGKLTLTGYEIKSLRAVKGQPLTECNLMEL